MKLPQAVKAKIRERALEPGDARRAAVASSRDVAH